MYIIPCQYLVSLIKTTPQQIWVTVLFLVARVSLCEVEKLSFQSERHSPAYITLTVYWYPNTVTTHYCTGKSI